MSFFGVIFHPDIVVVSSSGEDKKRLQVFFSNQALFYLVPAGQIALKNTYIYEIVLK